MTIDQALVTYLLTKTAITSIVSTRIRLQHAASGDSRPFITVTTDSDYAQHAGGGAGIADSEFTIRCESTTPIGAADLCETVRLALQDFAGTMGTVTVRSVVNLTSQWDVFRPEPGKETGYPAKTLSGTIWHYVDDPV